MLSTAQITLFHCVGVCLSLFFFFVKLEHFSFVICNYTSLPPFQKVIVMQKNTFTYFPRFENKSYFSGMLQKFDPVPGKVD